MRIVNKTQVASVKLTMQRMRPIVGGAHPDLLDFIALFYKRMDGRGIPVFAHTVVRSEAEQQSLYDDGFSRDSPKDGIWPHKGCAVDLIHSIYAWDMSEYEWLIFGEVGKELAIQRGLDMLWGGDWIKPGSGKRVGWDPAHWELRQFRSLAKNFPFEDTKNDERNRDTA